MWLRPFYGTPIFMKHNHKPHSRLKKAQTRLRGKKWSLELNLGGESTNPASKGTPQLPLKRKRFRGGHESRGMSILASLEVFRACGAEAAVFDSGQESLAVVQGYLDKVPQACLDPLEVCESSAYEHLACDFPVVKVNFRAPAVEMQPAQW